MKIGRIAVITKWMSALMIVLALLPSLAIAEATPVLDEQLIDAAQCGDLAQVKTLLDRGADVNAKDKSGFTVLMEAALRNQANILTLLVKKGADVNVMDESGDTALMYAAGAENAIVVKLLLDNGADVNAKNKYGTTALMFAVSKGYADIVRMLLDKGADLQSKNKFGMTVLRQAEIRNDQEIVKLLKRAGAVNGAPRYDQTVQRKAPTNNVEKDATSYPETPEEVVKAFVKEALEDVTVTVQEMWTCTEPLLVQDKYFPKYSEMGPDPENNPLNLDRYHITNGFEVKEVKEDHGRATVKILYKRLGWIWYRPIGLSDCRFLDGREASDNQRCRFLHITNDVQEVTYSLARPGKFWRIFGSYEPYISPSSAIKLLECEMRERPEVSGTKPSESQKIVIKQDIIQLRVENGP